MLEGILFLILLIIFFSYYSTAAGYIDNAVFSHHFSKVVLPQIHERQERFTNNEGKVPRACLLLDGHSSRRTIEVWKMACELGIDVHIIPSHTSHLIQPLDRCVFASLKRFVL